MPLVPIIPTDPVDSDQFENQRPVTAEVLAEQAAIFLYNEPPEVIDETRATHWVYVVNEDYNFSKQEQCAILYSDFPYIDDTPNEILRHKTLVRVLEEGVGRNNQYHLVEVVETNTDIDGTVGIISFRNVKELFPQKSLPVSYSKCKTGPITVNKKVDDFSKITVREWYETSEPFYDSNVCKYCINIETIHTKLGGTLLSMRKLRALREGVSRLLVFYNKDLSEIVKRRYLNNPLFARIESWYMDPNRAGSNLKFLVTIPAKYFDAISEKKILPRDLEGEVNGVARVVTFDSSDIVKQFKLVRRRFKSFEDSSDWKKFKYRYTGPANRGYGVINFRSEAKRLGRFLAFIRKILRMNGFSLRVKHPDRIEIGLSLDFKIKYIFYDDGSGAVSLNKGSAFYKKMEPFSLPRTCAYVFYSFEMADNLNTLTWKRVLKRYTHPVPEIKHSSDKCIEKFDDKLLCTHSDEKFDAFNKARDVSRNIKKIRRPGKPHKEVDYEDMLGLADDFKDKLKPAKAASAVKQELADIKNISTALDGKINSHYDRVSEDFVSFLVPKLKEFIDSFSFDKSNEKLISEVNKIFGDLTVKFPDFSKLLQVSHQSTCSSLEAAQEQMLQLGLLGEGTEVAQIADLAKNLSCDDVCQALPPVCSLDSLNAPSFPPRIDLPEIPTIDIMASFKEQLEKALMMSIFKTVANMSLNMLESFAVKAPRFQFPDLNLKNNFINDLETSLNHVTMGRALLDAGINIGDIPADRGISEFTNTFESPAILDRPEPVIFDPPSLGVEAEADTDMAPSFDDPVAPENIPLQPIVLPFEF